MKRYGHLKQFQSGAFTGGGDEDMATMLTWTPSHTWPTNTTTTQDAYVQTIGSKIWMGGTLKIATTGIPDNAGLILTMPAAYTIDSMYATNLPICFASVVDASTGLAYICAGATTSSTTIQFYTVSLAGLGQSLRTESGVSRTQPMTWASGDSIVITFGFYVVAA